MVTAIGFPSTRISSGSSTATSSRSLARVLPTTRSIQVSATCGSIVTGMPPRLLRSFTCGTTAWRIGSPATYPKNVDS